METTSTRPPAKEKKGLSRLWRRVKAAFKDKETTPSSVASTSQQAPPKAVGEQPARTTEDSTKEAPKSTLPISEPPPAATTAGDRTEETTPAEPRMQTDVDRRLARARELFKKYDFEIDESEWKADEARAAKPTERVQKTIRMRVRYTCHTCNTTFGHDKVCLSCQHPKCTKCIRYPPRKPKGKKKKTAPAAPIESTQNNSYACHECQSGFEIGVEECPNCRHKICERCLKEALVAVSPPPATAETEKKAALSEQHPNDPVPTTAS